MEELDRGSTPYLRGGVREKKGLYSERELKKRGRSEYAQRDHIVLFAAIRQVMVCWTLNSRKSNVPMLAST